jgi:hypothetical protein
MKPSTMLKSALIISLAAVPCACTTVVEPPKPETTTTVHRETRSTIYPAEGTHTQTTTTIQ